MQVFKMLSCQFVVDFFTLDLLSFYLTYIAFIDKLSQLAKVTAIVN